MLPIRIEYRGDLNEIRQVLLNVCNSLNIKVTLERVSDANVGVMNVAGESMIDLVDMMEETQLYFALGEVRREKKGGCFESIYYSSKRIGIQTKVSFHWDYRDFFGYEND